MTDTAEVDTGLTTGALQITSVQSPTTHPTHLVGPLAGLMLLVSAGILPTHIDWKSVAHVPSRTTPDTTSRLTIQDTVSSADILRAIANIHDTLLEGAIDLKEEARKVLYEQLWNLYE
jgi:hypothetical protein